MRTKMQDTPHLHEWWVYSTSLCPPTIMVYCSECDASGWVTNYTECEWSEAYHAPSRNYKWAGKGMVRGIKP